MTATDDDPRWRQPEESPGCHAVMRMGPPPRGLAAEANDCFMVWSRRDQPNTRSRRDPSRAGRAPLGSSSCSPYSAPRMEAHRRCRCECRHYYRAARRVPQDHPCVLGVPTARSLTPCSALSRCGLETPTPPHPRSDGQPRQPLRAASSQPRRPGRRNSAQAEQRNRTKHHEISLTERAPYKGILWAAALR